MPPDETTREAEIILDRARAAKEVAIVTALVLMANEGDPEASVEALEGMPGALAADELDCALIAQQAIREAITLRATGALPDA